MRYLARCCRRYIVIFQFKCTTCVFNFEIIEQHEILGIPIPVLQSSGPADNCINQQPPQPHTDQGGAQIPKFPEHQIYAKRAALPKLDEIS